MCAQYGLGGGLWTGQPDLDIPPMDERENKVSIDAWMEERKHSARLTGPRALNFNPVIRVGGSGGRELEFAWWWLWVHGKKAPFDAFNSRDNKLTSSWKAPFQNRVILPATWYVEKGQTFALDGELFGIAGISTTVKRDGEPDLLTYSMVTRPGIGDAEHVLSNRGEARMPMILPRDFHDEWLDPNRAGDQSLVGEALIASDEICRATKNYGKIS